MTKNLGYTDKEKEYSKKSWYANLGGGFLQGFSTVGFGKKVPKILKNGKAGFGLVKSAAGTRIGLVGFGLSAGLASYYDLQAIKNSKKKSRALVNAVGRGFAGNFLGGFGGFASAAYLRYVGLPKVKSFVKTNETTRFYIAKPVNDAAKLGNMMKQKAVKFIRIRGRIVPIRAKSVRVGPALLPPPKG